MRTPRDRFAARARLRRIAGTLLCADLPAEARAARTAADAHAWREAAHPQGDAADRGDEELNAALRRAEDILASLGAHGGSL